MTHTGIRITKNPGYATDELLELGWEKRDIMIVLDRIIALAKGGEDYVEVSRRLNPSKVTRPSWTPKTDHARVLRESPSLDPALSVRVRDARNRLNI